MKHALFLLPLIALATPAAFADNVVVCKAEISASDSTKPVFADLKPTHEDADNQYLGAQIGGVQFEIQASKGIFYFKPYIRTADGQELSGEGYFGADDTIRLDWKMGARNGVAQTADLRCCRDCTFSDWPKE